MNEMKKMAKELAKRHNHSVEGLAAWAIGYIGTLEREIDSARIALGVEPREMTLIENLRDTATDQVS